MLTIYGIPNCDKVRKARKWLKENNVENMFHDIRVDGVDVELIKSFVDKIGWEKLINKRGRNWQAMDKTQQEINNNTQAIELIISNPVIMHRPIVSQDGEITIGLPNDLK